MSLAVVPLAAALVLTLGGSLYAQGAAATAPPAPPRSRFETAAAELAAGGKPREALAQLDRAWAVYQRSRDQAGLARVSLARANAHRALGAVDAAVRHAEEAQRLAAADPALRVSALTFLAAVANDRRDSASSERYLREALPIAERAADAGAQLRVLQALATLADTKGQQRDALVLRMRAMELADRAGTPAQRVETRFGASSTLLSLSRYDEALARAQEGHDIAEQQSSPRVRASGLFQLAQANNHVWNLDRASALWGPTFDAYREAGEVRGQALALGQSANTWFALGDFDRAAADAEQAVALMRQIGLTLYVAETAARVALSHARRGRLDEAAKWSAAARQEIPTTPESRHLFVHNDLGLVAIDLGQFDQARSDFARVLDVARTIGNVEYEWRAGWGQGRTAIGARQPAAAIPYLEGVIGTIERLRQTIPAASERAAFMTQRVGPYETLVEALMDTAAASGDAGGRRALEVAERARSRALADLLAESRARLTDPGLLAVRKEEAAFGARFSAIQSRAMAAADAESRRAALDELQRAEQEYEALVRRVRRESPAYAALAYPRALTADEIAAIVAPDEAVVEFLITPKRGFAWAIRRDGIHAGQVPGQDRLEPQLRLLQALLASDDERALGQLGSELHAQLLAPLAAGLGGARRLIIVPDGVLQRLPFALLRSGDRWLIETHALTTAPSATILGHLRQTPRGHAAQPLLALAAPDVSAGAASAVLDFAGGSGGTLSLAAREVQAAGRIVGARREDTLVGAAASERVLKARDIRGYRMLHFAAHAVVDEIVPRRSAVLLTAGGDEDGLLQVNEIANLSLDADLVVLAACRSQMGRLVRGEGLLSLSRAFMHAGARSVMATLWDVADRETSWLMRRFYEALGDAAAPDEALRAAQIDALHGGGPAALPRNWAAFVLTGDATAPVLDARTRWPWPLVIAAAALGLMAVWLAVRRRRAPAPTSARTAPTAM